MGPVMRRATTSRPDPTRLHSVRVRRSIVTVVAAAFAATLAACSGDANAEGTTDFCTVLSDALPTMNGDAITGAPDDRAEVAAAFARVADAAPSDVADDWDTLADLFGEVSSVDMSEDGAFGDVFGAAIDSDVRLASERVIEHARTECAVTLGSPPN
jgi:hypothetical protein